MGIPMATGRIPLGILMVSGLGSAFSSKLPGIPMGISTAVPVLLRVFLWLVA